MKVERLEDIVQEINQTGESLISHLSPARHGEMIERSQEVVKYQIWTIVINWCKTPQEKQRFQTNTAQPWKLKEYLSNSLSLVLSHLAGVEAVQGEGQTRHHPPLEPGEEDARLGLVGGDDEVGGPERRPEDEQDQAAGVESSYRHLQREEKQGNINTFLPSPE